MLVNVRELWVNSVVAMVVGLSFFQNPDLVARLEQVQAMADNKTYKRMVKNVDVSVSTHYDIHSCCSC